ncbi:MAG: DUF6519 domain-containing protein [Verrucomicrobiota bacterium]|nr:DUF6519 domain-containing protein [Verrucomicrobiota bacterium]
MKNDITRDTFDRLNHFRRVLMQQGRVQLDADWNEQVSILVNYLQTMMADLVGQSAGPAANCGFGLILSAADITALNLTKDQAKQLQDRLDSDGILIGPGRYYVDGVPADNEDYAALFKQPFNPLSADSLKEMETQGKGPAVVYLDVWERHLTALDFAGMREIALGGPDTATRAQINWAVRARPLTRQEAALKPPPTKANTPKFQAAFDGWNNLQTQNRATMRARIEPEAQNDDPCANSTDAVYRGLENQLYRVEIHQGGSGWDGKSKKAPDATATFKWSRDNGSVVAAWLEGDDENVLRVTPSHDHARGFSAGQWVELSDDHNDLAGVPGTLVQLKSVEAGGLTLDPATTHGSSARSDFPNTPKVRRWDQEENENIALPAGAIQIQYDTWFALEDGIEVQFPTPPAAFEVPFRSGDYWLIPARVASRDIEWPYETLPANAAENATPDRRALPPHGVDHHYALIGLLSAAAPAGASPFTDLRRRFIPSLVP